MENISLSNDVKNFLQNQVAAGIYKSISEAVNANIEIIIVQESMLQQQKLIMNEEIRKGIQDAENGRVYHGLDFMNDLIAKYE